MGISTLGLAEERIVGFERKHNVACRSSDPSGSDFTHGVKQFVLIVVQVPWRAASFYQTESRQRIAEGDASTVRLCEGVISMFSATTLMVFSLAALGLLIIPGPAVLYIVTRSAAHGRRAGLASVAGIELATLAHILAAAIGLSALLMASALAFNVVKYVGAAYLVYLGIRALMARTDSSPAEKEPSRTYAQLLGKGFLVNLLNPKTALFFYSFLPQFVDPLHGRPFAQIVALGGLFVGLATCTDSAYALLGAGVGAFFARKTGIRKVRRFVTGGIYIALGIGAAATGNGKE
jgi:threonine/homoserine/homoserine lactone efflux protein